MQDKNIQNIRADTSFISSTSFQERNLVKSGYGQIHIC